MLRAPEGAKLPQAVLDKAGTLHLIYYTGSMSSGDLFYVTRLLNSGAWAAPPAPPYPPSAFPIQGFGLILFTICL